MTQPNIHSRPNRSYKLVPYDPVWKKRFEELATELSPIFGENFIKIEHIGSTSVPGMIAKPQIDAILVVKDLDHVKDLYTTMSNYGFKSFGNFIQKAEPEEYFAKDNELGERLFSVHVMQEGNPEIEDTINFRDYLVANSEARDAYINYKQKLMQEFGDQDYNSYGKGKVNFLEELKSKARAWQEKNLN
ncbi:MAG: hypothetical protein A2675_01660 [Candidatus Yonathbacteria bacterium RIFCSPHIGHO2_01_FULL_51_10]|uniref:GrpB family protein n=1 Tax=Candidatus Yonathbacteria bacterium RIFCSPHIGHO2_01_FULL_51_10 TaxID=1802723 RepID=A0A1G2S6X5_9BACT|nr:MAG: hypothetical protein A2675_01660 [Candidatus Yonathbacteria bacterium RIFCSPHIGHO2_01_FULL_51_10]